MCDVKTTWAAVDMTGLQPDNLDTLARMLRDMRAFIGDVVLQIHQRNEKKREEDVDESRG